MKILLTDRTFMGYACSQGLVFAAMFAYISGSSFVFQNIFGVFPQMYSVIFAVMGIVIAGAGLGSILSYTLLVRPQRPYRTP